VQTPSIEYQPDVSPDGRYVAYQSTESGQDEIYVRPFPDVAGGIWTVSTGGGTHPVWARNGQELYYLDPTLTVTAVPVQRSGRTLRFGNPAKLFAIASQGPYEARRYDVAADGRFVVVKPAASAQKRPGLIVVVNWDEELLVRVPTRQ
jgi:serine/threonine-protein kinase